MQNNVKPTFLTEWIHGCNTVVVRQNFNRESPSVNEPIVVSGLADEIAYRLRAEILDGKLPSGARLQHEELATRFGVSRTPIREALRQLQALNLVVVSPNRGATVRVLSRAELQEGYELRAELEGFACELACQRASESELSELEQAQARLAEAVVRVKEMQEIEFDASIAQWNNVFHACIYNAAGNRQLGKCIEQLQHLFPHDSVWRAIIDDPAAFLRMNVEEHVAIAAALRSRDSVSARNAMRDHVRGAGKILIAHLDKRDFWK
jgi:DNA-binding GntR family transcriptional regulator